MNLSRFRNRMFLKVLALKIAVDRHYFSVEIGQFQKSNFATIDRLSQAHLAGKVTLNALCNITFVSHKLS